MNKKDKQWLQMSRFEIFLKKRKYIALVLTLVAMVCWGLNVPNETAYCLVEEYYKKNKSDEAMNVQRKIYNIVADVKNSSHDYYVYFDGAAVKAKQIVFEK